MNNLKKNQKITIIIIFMVLIFLTILFFYIKFFGKSSQSYLLQNNNLNFISKKENKIKENYFIQNKNGSQKGFLKTYNKYFFGNTNIKKNIIAKKELNKGLKNTSNSSNINNKNWIIEFLNINKKYIKNPFSYRNLNIISSKKARFTDYLIQRGLYYNTLDIETIKLLKTKRLSEIKDWIYYVSIGTAMQESGVTNITEMDKVSTVEEYFKVLNYKNCKDKKYETGNGNNIAICDFYHNILQNESERKYFKTFKTSTAGAISFIQMMPYNFSNSILKEKIKYKENEIFDYTWFLQNIINYQGLEYIEETDKSFDIVSPNELKKCSTGGNVKNGNEKCSKIRQGIWYYNHSIRYINSLLSFSYLLWEMDNSNIFTSPIGKGNIVDTKEPYLTKKVKPKVLIDIIGGKKMYFSISGYKKYKSIDIINNIDGKGSCYLIKKINNKEKNNIVVCNTGETFSIYKKVDYIDIWKDKKVISNKEETILKNKIQKNFKIRINNYQKIQKMNVYGGEIIGAIEGGLYYMVKNNGVYLNSKMLFSMFNNIH